MSFIKLLFPPEPPSAVPADTRSGVRRFLVNTHFVSIALISLAIAFTSAIFLVQLRHETEQRAYATLERRLQVFRQLLDHHGGIAVSGGKMVAGGTVLHGNFEAPDKMKEIFGTTAAIFMGDTAISTNAVTGTGERALPARLTGAPYDAVFKENRRFRGEADVSGTRYFMAYDPIRDEKGDPVGALHVAIPDSDFFKDYEKRRTEVVVTALLVDIIFVLLSITIIRQRKKHTDALHRSEALYRTLFDGSTEGIVLLKETVAACNDRACELLGLPRNQLLGMRAAEVLPTVDFVTAPPEERVVPWHCRRQDGRALELEISLRRLQTHAGPAWQVMLRDVTVQKQAATLLAAEKRAFEMIVQGKPLPEILSLICTAFEEVCDGALCSILVTDAEGKRLLHGAAPSLPAEYSAAVNGTRIGQSIGACGTAAFTGEPVICNDIATDPNWAKYKDLPLKHGLRACWSTPVISSDRQVLGTFAIYYRTPHQPDADEMSLVDRASNLVSIAIDRTRAREALQDAYLKQQAILDNIPDLVWMKDLEGRFVIVNEAFAAACASTPSVVVGKKDLDLWPPDLADQYRLDDMRVVETKEKKRVEEYLEDTEGKRFWIETIKTPVFKDGAVIGTTGIARDIDVRKRGEAALRESEERFHEFFTQNWDAVILLNQDTMEVVGANPAAVELFGYQVEELRELSLLRVIGPESLQAFSALLQDVAEKKDSIIDHAEGVGKNGRKIEMSVRARLIQVRQESVVYCSFRDITERMRLEAEQREVQSRLIQANKMTSLGMLVSGIAHEINNPNQFITINASLMADIWRHAVPVLDTYQAEHGEFLLKGLPYSQIRETAPRLIAGIEEGAQRINSIIRNLKEFVRDSSAQNQEEFDLHEVVHAAVMILTHAIHKHTDYFTLDLEEGLPRVKGKAQLIEQVVINLLSNALEALSGKDRGIRVSSRFDAETGLVVLSVIDEGKGMNRAVLERITEPFYSTRLDEGGTGLGLSISASIIKEHGGTLDFASSPGVGTAATITLRVADRACPAHDAGDADREAGDDT